MSSSEEKAAAPSQSEDREAEIHKKEKKAKKAKPKSKKDKKKEKKHKHKASDSEKKKTKRKPKSEESSKSKSKKPASEESSKPKKKPAAKRKKPEASSAAAKPKRVIKVVPPAEALLIFPPEGIHSAPDKHGRYVKSVIYQAAGTSDQVFCSKEQLDEINRNKTGMPRTSQVCWIEIGVQGHEPTAVALAVRRDASGAYYPLTQNAEKRLCKSYYDLDYPKLKPRVLAYRNRLPLALGLEEYTGEFAGISFVSDRWFLKDEKEMKLEELVPLDKMKFSEKRPYIPAPMKKLVGNLMDAANADDNIEQSYDDGGRAASSSEEDKPVASSNSSSSSSSEEEEASASEEESADSEPKAKRAKNGKTVPEPPVRPPNFVAKPQLAQEAIELQSLVPLADTSTDPVAMRDLIKRANQSFAVQLAGGDAQRTSPAFAISRTEKTAVFIEKKPVPEKRPTVKLDTDEQPQEREPSPVRASSPPPPMPEKSKPESKKRAAPAGESVEKPAKKQTSPAESSGALRPRYTNFMVAAALRDHVLKNPQNLAKFDKIKELDALLQQSFSFAELIDMHGTPDANPDLYALLQLWFEFFCKENDLAVETRGVDEDIRDWLIKMKDVGKFDRKIELVEKSSVSIPATANKLCCYKLAERAARDQLSMTKTVRKLFQPLGQLFKLFPERDNLSEEDYKKTLRTNPNAQALLYSALILYEQAKKTGTCIRAAGSEAAAPAAEPEEEEMIF